MSESEIAAFTNLARAIGETLSKVDLMNYAVFPSQENLERISFLLNFEQTFPQARQVSSDNCTLLLMVCRSGNVPADLVRKLIDIFPEATLLRGGLLKTTPLAMVAERGGSIEAAKVLIEANPKSLFCKDGPGRTPEQIAKQYHNGELARFLHAKALELSEYGTE